MIARVNQFVYSLFTDKHAGNQGGIGTFSAPKARPTYQGHFTIAYMTNKCFWVSRLKRKKFAIVRKEQQDE